MPSFADPRSKKLLTIEERWHVANYAHSLAGTAQLVRPENTVVKADRIDGDLPQSPGDPKWAESEPSTFYLVPQIIAKERFFTPSNDTITVRALYNDEAVALLLEWDDRTRSLPGDPGAETVAGPGLSEDAVAVQLPVAIPEGMRKPYFGMGDASHPVNIWHWKSGSADGSESVRLLDARGFGDIEERTAGESRLRAVGAYDAGTWRVVMVRSLSTDALGQDIQLKEGRFTPIAFAAWDGSNGEGGSKHTMTTWYWLLLKPPTGPRPYLVALAVMILIAGGQIWWARSAAIRRRDPEV
jgi:DMSO reductase family type II enzyme heme b subunit